MSGPRIHHISAGTMCPLGAKLINGEGGLLSPAHMVCHCWLIESDDGLILVDTGVGTRDLEDIAGRLGRVFKYAVRPSLDPESTAIAQIRKLGFNPADVRHIIPTHLDLDHAGGLPDFPDATVYIFEPEHRAAMNPATLPERERYRPQHWAHGPRWSLRSEQGERWFGFAGVRAIPGIDDVLLIPLQGHTRGHCGIAVRTEQGWWLHAGDAYFFHAEMRQPSRCPPGLVLFQRLVAIDNRMRLDNQARLRELVRDHGSEVRVHCAHCVVEFEAARAS
jgi:glyoxylase-like metal-dependent hydrolase (beta-lactamase superfamily II)